MRLKLKEFDTQCMQYGAHVKMGSWRHYEMREARGLHSEPLAFGFADSVAKKKGMSETSSAPVQERGGSGDGQWQSQAAAHAASWHSPDL